MFNYFNYLNRYVLMQCYPTNMGLCTHQFYLFNISKIFDVGGKWCDVACGGHSVSCQSDPDRQRVGVGVLAK